jgi:hypothetical protein
VRARELIGAQFVAIVVYLYPSFLSAATCLVFASGLANTHFL